MDVGLIGTGAFGSLMAVHLAGQFDTHVWNRTFDNVPESVRSSCNVHTDLTELVASTRRLVVSLHGESAIREVFFGSFRLIDQLQPGALVIDTSTTSPWFAREIGGALAERGVAYFDCPVAGGLEGAERGELVTFVGGPQDRYADVIHILAAFSRASHHLGEVGAGQTGKALNVLILGTTMVGLAEAMVVAERSGLDTSELLAALGKGTAQSWALERRAANMIASEHSKKGTCELIARDLEVSYELAVRAGVDAPATRQAMERYAETLARGFESVDISAIIELYR